MSAVSPVGWGARIKSALKAKAGFRYEDAMSHLGRGKSSVFEYEKEDRVPDIEFLRRLRDYTGVSIDWLITGAGPQTGGLDRSALSTAVTAAMKIVESARAQGKAHTPQDVVTFIVDIYESVIKESLDKDIPSTDSEQNSLSQESPSDARRRKTHS